MMKWDYYQGDGRDGPFGLDGGWFVNWHVDADGFLTFILERDTQSDDKAEDEEAEREFVQEWLEEELGKKWSPALQRLRAAVRRTGGRE